MRILVLHSDVPPDAPPEEIDTLTSAEAVAQALLRHGHDVAKAPFTTDPDRFARLLAAHRADVVFNLVEGIDGIGAFAPVAPRMLDEAGAIYTGAGAVAMAVTSDKPLAKRRMREAGIATPDWCEPPDWHGLGEGTYIVKSTLEDASVGLDDGCIVTGAEAVKRRAAESAHKHGGKWFAEQYIDGREYNISMMQGADGEPIVMPLAEMRFEGWPSAKPRIVGYDAKWIELDVNDLMVRDFGTAQTDPVLAAKLKSACERVWRLFGFTGYVRVDFRVTSDGEPLVLEINTNPCIAPDAGFAAAGEQAGIPYDQLIARLVDSAVAGARG
ncbi:MAG: ATP-grasp domain-containing protein [Rhizomicrobium sp.]